MRKRLRDNGLSLVLLGIFLAILAGQSLVGWDVYNKDQQEHGEAAVGYIAYLQTPAFMEVTFENWESEFLQMCAYVMLTAYLYQRGSPESKDPDSAAPQDRDPAADADNPDAPWPVRKGGLWRALYSHSLGLAMLFLFASSFVLHWLNSARQAADEALAHGQPPPTAMEHLVDSQFWFESFQNWQSEFLSTAVLVALAVFLRERGSPESKPVGAPHSQTGT